MAPSQGSLFGQKQESQDTKKSDDVNYSGPKFAVASAQFGEPTPKEDIKPVSVAYSGPKFGVA